jgi:hypothetical protein
MPGQSLLARSGPIPSTCGTGSARTGDLKFGTLAEKPVAGGSGGGGPSPLDFLLGVMADPAATPRQRAKAASIAARYKHAYAGGVEAPSIIVAEDKFGFKVDPELARAERDDRVREIRLGEFKPHSAEGIAAARELEQIRQRRAERVAQVKFPDGYFHGDREADKKRLQQLYSKRLSRRKFTPEEDAEEAHLAVRVLGPVAVPVLSPEVAKARQLEPMTIEWPTSRIAELDERVVGGETLTATEEAERQDLRRRYPDSAAQADMIDHRYRYWNRKEFEIAEKSGMKWSDAVQAARDKCERLRDPTKVASASLPPNLPDKIRQLETLRWDNVLTPEEADELEELHRRYPDLAQKTREGVDRRLSYDQDNREAMLRTGYDPGPIKEDRGPRGRTGPARLSKG